MNTKLALTLAALGCLAPANAALLFYEGFDYTDSNASAGYGNGTNLSTLGSGWTITEGTPQVGGQYAVGQMENMVEDGGYVHSTNFLYPLAASEANGNYSISQTIGASVTSTFTPGTVTWISMLHYNSTQEDWRFALGSDIVENLSTDGQQGIGFGGIGSQGQRALTWDGGTEVATSNNGITNRPRLTIARITWAADGVDDEISIRSWNDFNTLLPAGLVASDFDSGSILLADLDQSTFNTISLDVYSTAIDEIRIASDLSSVISGVPEPSSAVLGGLGVLALLRRRRN